MNGHDFIHFAGKLAASNASGAAGYRSATSRAYYGAYHLARSYLHAFGFHCHEANEHQWVQRHFYHCATPEAHEVGQFIRNLHESRKEADYELLVASAEGQPSAMTNVLRAEEIRRRLGICQNEALSSRIRNEMLAYRARANVA